MNGVSGSQEYLPAMIDRIISCMPQEQIYLKQACENNKGSVMTNKGNL